MVKKKPGDGDYDVGFGKPPKSGQFRPGQSGNKTGRPKGAKNFKTELKEVLESKIPITQNGKKTHITKQRAMFETTIAKALKGDVKAAGTMFGMAGKYLLEEMEENELLQPSEDDQEIIERYIARRLELLLAEERKKKDG